MDQQHDYITLMRYWEEVPDPRQAHGKQYEWRYLLALLCGALVSGHKTVRAMGEWAKSHRDELLQQLQPVKPRIPSASILRRVLRRLDIAQLERQIAAYGRQVDASDPTSGVVTGQESEAWRGQALDGKEVRGASAHGAPVILVDWVRHESGGCWGKRGWRSGCRRVRPCPSWSRAGT